MSDQDPSPQSIELAFTVRKDTDDPSIIAAVRQALIDGIARAKAGIPAGSFGQPGEPEPSAEQPEPDRVPKREGDIREHLQAALEKQFEEYQRSGRTPAFDGTAWSQQLVKVWALIAEGMQKGYMIEVGELLKHGMPPTPPADEGSSS